MSDSCFHTSLPYVNVNDNRLWLLKLAECIGGADWWSEVCLMLHAEISYVSK